MLSFSGGGVNVSAGSGDIGIRAEGGQAGVLASGGTGGSKGGFGLISLGGDSFIGNGGDGVAAAGGGGGGVGNTAGAGITASGGFGQNGAANGLAGKFLGDVDVKGNLSKTTGTFKIDHPLDPENKYLYHSFVESPDMMNVYNGDVTTDENGDAVVSFPDWFEALNKDFRYQLTVIGTFAQAIVASKIKKNSFSIKTNAPNVEVSWQVTGIRQDAYANAHRVKVEVDKPEAERGYYLHPEVFGQPEEKGIEWARHQELMRQHKQMRVDPEQTHQNDKNAKR